MSNSAAEHLTWGSWATLSEAASFSCRSSSYSGGFLSLASNESLSALLSPSASCSMHVATLNLAPYSPRVQESYSVGLTSLLAASWGECGSIMPMFNMFLLCSSVIAGSCFSNGCGCNYFKSPCAFYAATSRSSRSRSLSSNCQSSSSGLLCVAWPSSAWGTREYHLQVFNHRGRGSQTWTSCLVVQASHHPC